MESVDSIAASKLVMPCADSELSLSSPLCTVENWHPNPDAVDPEIEKQELARFLLCKVDWGHKIQRCESLHPFNAKCTILPSWVLGSRHLVRTVEFEDGMKLVLKLPLPTDSTPEGKAMSNFGIVRREYKAHLCFQ